jgi:alpha-beta hydrolase superfamily lysophospholipase
MHVEPQPRLIEVVVPDNPQGIVLVLHGGASRGAKSMVTPAQLSVLRMVPVALRIARRAHGRLAIFRVLNSRRGWNPSHTPVQDVLWALDRALTRLGCQLPTSLVGHSLGGRAALLAASGPTVRSVVALAPWVYPTDIPSGLVDQQILFVHGTDDRIAAPSRSAALAEALAPHARVTYIDVVDGKHAMIRRHRVFDELAAQYVALTLLRQTTGETMRRIQAGVGRLRL